MTHTLESLKQSLTEMGMTKVAHLDGTLLAHMENVYRILGRLEQPEPVRLAALFHGTYGTHALHSSDVFQLPAGKREHIQELIGNDAERLVYAFCVMTYESLGRSFRSVLRPKGRHELWDRCAGARLDLSGAEFDQILWLKFADLLAHVPQLSSEVRSGAAREYGPFWQVVAEYLGPKAVAEWNATLGDVAKLPTRTTP